MLESPTDQSQKSNKPTHKLPPGPSGSIRSLLREPLRFFLTLTQQYGDVVRYRAAPEPAYLINHPDYVKYILVTNNRNYSKDTYINQKFKSAVADGLLVSEGEVWRQQRRLMQPAFHHQRIAKLGGLVCQEAEIMLQRWKAAAQSGQPIDIAKEMASVTLGVTGQALFGVTLGKRAGSVGEAVSMAATLLGKPRHARFQEAFRIVQGIVNSIIEERRQLDQDTGDLLSMLLQARDEETGLGMDDRQLRDQVLTLILAGYETTSSALTWTWFLLSQYPGVMETLRAEVGRVLEGRTPTYADLPNLSYVRMVFEESMRLFPPAWILGRKALADDEIGGYYVPANSVVAISPYTLHRHPEFWENPEIFNPERFTSEGSAGRHHFAYIPFGAGPRQCIGNNLAMMEAQIIIAMIAQKYSLELIPGQEIKPEPLFILRPNQEILMSLREHPGAL